MIKIIFIFCLFLVTFNFPSLGQEKLSRLLSVKQNDKCGYINNNGKIVIPLEFDTCWNFSEGLAGVIVNNKLGFINKKGQFIVEPKFNFDLVWFSEGFATVSIGESRKDDLKRGFVDRNGKVIFLPLVTSLHDFSEGLASFEKHGRRGYIDTQMNIVIQPKYKHTGSFYDGLARVTDENDNSYYINKTGQKVIDREGSDFSEGLASFEFGDKAYGTYFGFIDTKGNVVIHPIFRRVDWFYEGLCGAQDPKTNKWGFIDKTGKFVIKPQFEEVERFSEGYAQVKLDSKWNGKWGYINRAGKIVIPVKFDTVDDFIEGIASVEINDKWYYINKLGKYIWHPSK